MKWFEELKMLFSKDEKTQKPEPRKFEISWSENREMLEMLDVITTQKGRKAGCCVVQARLWKLVEDLFPETKDGLWRISNTGSRLFVIEEI